MHLDLANIPASKYTSLKADVEPLTYMPILGSQHILSYMNSLAAEYLLKHIQGIMKICCSR